MTKEEFEDKVIPLWIVDAETGEETGELLDQICGLCLEFCVSQNCHLMDPNRYGRLLIWIGAHFKDLMSAEIDGEEFCEKVIDLVENTPN